MSVFADLQRISGGREPGPSPSFSPAHMTLAFMTVGSSGLIGRQALAEKVGLGGGSVRTVVKKLREEGLIRVIASGCSLTPKGNQVYRKVRSRLSDPVELEGSTLTMGARQSAIAVRRAASGVRQGIEQRDSAVKVGASGATTYVISDSKFTVPNGSTDCERDFPSPLWGVLRDELQPNEGDVVIVSGSADRLRSLLGAVAAALTLV